MPRPWAASARSMFLSYIRRNTTLKLFAGISVITGADESNRLLHPGERFEVSQAQCGLRSRRLGRTLGCSGLSRTLRVCKGHRDKNGDAGGSIAAAPLIQSSVASHGEM